MVITTIPGIGKVAVKPNDEYRELPKLGRTFNLPEAPTLYPSTEEFKDPHQYLSSLTDLGQHYGILKIIPPSTWKPEFSLDTMVGT